MTFLHEVHKVVGPKERDFEAVIRDELRAIFGVDDRARLLWYLHQAHGTGPAYTVITITAFSDAAAWHDMAVRIHAGDLRGFMALVTQCDLMLCSDSGPMHVASALGVPVTALFGPQRREWYGPRGELDRVVQVDEMACRPCFDACIFATPLCMEGITADAVADAVITQLDRIETHNAGVAWRG